MEPLSWFLVVKKIPRQVWFCLGLFLILAGTHWYTYNAGKDNVQAKWDLSIERGKAIVAELKQKQTVIEERIVIRYVDRVKTIHEKGKTIEKLIPYYIPVDTPDLPSGFRVLHDAAATNTVPEPSAGVGALPVPVKDVAETLNFNYAQCHQEREKLNALWEWAQLNRKAYLELCKQRGVTCN